MEIRNEEHAREMLREWEELPVPARIREIRLAIEKLELSSMYYEQKGNNNGVERVDRCAGIFAEYLDTIE